MVLIGYDGGERTRGGDGEQMSEDGSARNDILDE